MPDYEIITTEDELDSVINEVAKLPRDNPMEVPCLDIETRPGHPDCEANDRFTCKLAGISMSWADDKAAYIPLDHVDGNNLRFNRIVESNIIECLNKLRPIATQWPWSNHVCRFDWGVLRQPRFNLVVNYQHCSYVEAFLTGKYTDMFKFEQGGSDAGLKSLALRLFGYVMKNLEEIGGKDPVTGKIDAGLPPAEAGAFYACDDANYARKIHRALYPVVKDMWLYKVEMPLWEYVEIMEENGIPFKADACKEQLGRLLEFTPKAREMILTQAERQLGYRPEVNLDSPSKVAVFLYDELKLPCTVFSKKTKKPSTSAKAMAQLEKDFDIVHNFLRYKKLRKADTGFLSTLPNYIHPITGKIHSTYHQGGVPTGRFANSNPNTQNLSDEKEYVLKDGDYRESIIINVRDAMEVPEDELLYFHDNKQAEMWVALEYGKEYAVLDLIGQGMDTHTVTGSFLFHCTPEQVTKDQRKNAKTRNFAIIYGESPAGMAEKLGIEVEEAAEFMSDYFQRFPGISISRTNIIQDSKAKWFVNTYFGRHVDLEQLYSHPDHKVRDHGERLAYNAVMQGTAADIAKIQMLKAGQVLKNYFNPVPIIHQGHDALGYRLTPANFNMQTLPNFHRLVKSTVEFNIPGFRLPVRTDCKVGWKYGTLIDYSGESYGEVVEKLRDKTASKKLPVEVETNKQEHVLLLPERPLSTDDIVAIKSLLQRTPGNNILYISYQSGADTTILAIEKYPTSLGLKDAAKFQMIVPCKLVAQKPGDVLGDIVKSMQ